MGMGDTIFNQILGSAYHNVYLPSNGSLSFVNPIRVSTIWLKNAITLTPTDCVITGTFVKER